MRKLVALKKNNSGSAMLTVVIAMLFIVALGTALLSASYLTFTVATGERGSSKNFYSASKALDEIRLGLQKDCGTFASDACTNTLTDYAQGNLGGKTPQTYCAEKYTSSLYAKSVSNSDGTSTAQPLFTIDSSTKLPSSYNKDALKNYLSLSEGVDMSGSSGTVTLTKDNETLKSITLNNVVVKYTNNGYQTAVSSDIILTVPDFFAAAALPSSLNGYSIVAEKGLLGMGVNRTITGDVFAGAAAGGNSIWEASNGDALTFTGGDVYCPGSVVLAGSTSLTLGNEADSANQLWAKSIGVGPSAKLNLTGDVSVAGDLSVTGANANVTLAGKYFGFGNGTNVNVATGETEAQKSSAVLIGGRSTTLDLSNLQNFTLAGVSFVNVNSTGPSVRMGQSVATKPDQLAYLLPAECLTQSGYVTNPFMDSTPTIFNEFPGYKGTYVLWNGKTLDSYLTRNGKATAVVKSFRSSTGIVKTFIVFSDQDAANDYFRDYYASNPAAVLNYVNQYMTLTGAPSATTRGTTYSKSGDSTELGTTTTAGTTTQFMQSRYEQLSQSPFSQFVDMTEYSSVLNAIGDGKTAEYKDDSTAVAVVANGDYTYNNENDPSGTIRLIVASGNVTVDKEFKGLILAQGQVTANASITSKTDELKGYKNAKYDTHVLGSLIRLGGSSTDGNTGSPWTSDTLVQYSNWKKNG